MDIKGKKMLSGALVLGVAAFIAKLLGAIYRIPLTKIIGSAGLGLYQMVFPVYALLLDFSGAGVPNAMAKLISAHKGAGKEIYARKLLKKSLVFFSALGAALSLLTAVFSKSIAAAQGNADAAYAYLFLAPSVFLVCIICCFRGYFQGFMNMTPTAFSQIAEQVVKLAAGLFLANLFLPDIKKAAAGATLAITLSELVALAGLVLIYALKRKRDELKPIGLNANEFSVPLKRIIAYAAPIAAAAMILPLSKVIDSFLIINMLTGVSENPTGAYGIYSGVCLTVVGLPVAVCYGISAVAVPAVSSADENRKNKDAIKTVLLTLAVSVPSAALCAAFAPLIIRILFGYFSESERVLSVNLLRITSPCIILLSLLQTLNGVLIGKGNPKKPIIGLVFGVAIKTAIEIFTLKNPEINVNGAGIAAIACYFVADLVNLSMVFPLKAKRKRNASLPYKRRRYADS